MSEFENALNRRGVLFASGAVEIVDCLSAPGPDTPILQIPDHGVTIYGATI